MQKKAGVVELVDTPDLGSGAARCGGSSPFTRTERVIKSRCKICSFFITSNTQICVGMSYGEIGLMFNLLF